jgi:hypothetical protein
MARMTSDQWAEMRREWESSPTQGLTWLTKAGGGRWNITEEPIRKRRAAQGWAKPANMATIVQRAHAAADTHSAERMTMDPKDPVPGATMEDDVGGFQAKRHPPSPDARSQAGAQPSAGVEEIAVDLRTELLGRHRKEWDEVRRLFYRSLKEAESARGFEAAKFAKISAETLELIQRGETRAWGLDALMIDFDSMSVTELEALVKSGRLPR